MLGHYRRDRKGKGERGKKRKGVNLVLNFQIWGGEERREREREELIPVSG